MTDIIATYYDAYKALEPFAVDLEDMGLTDDRMYRDYVAYREGYELVRAELMDYLGITAK